MNMFIKYGLITDDSIWGTALSSYFQEENKYFPIISIPRMNRNDWQDEVYKRFLGIIRTDVEIFFCKGEDYGLLAPLRSIIKQTLIPLKYYYDVFKFIQFQTPKETLIVNELDYLPGLLKAKSQKKKIKFNKNSSSTSIISDLISVNSRTIVIIEIVNEITDISAINYAFCKEYDILLINKLTNSQSKEIKSLFKQLSIKPEAFEKIKKELSAILLGILNFKELEQKYDRFQFFVSDLPLGIFIENNSIAHLLHLQSELRIIDEYFYIEKQDREKEYFVPSFLFIDIHSKDLVSEIPDISSEIENYKYWSFHINGKYANRINFNIYSRYFPFDLIFVSGHGSSPDCREVTYKFKSRDGKEHFAKILEYYQFGRVKGEMVEVETKEYFLEFDGINWEDKRALAENGISHILLEYEEARDNLELVKYKNLDPESIEGLLLSDGIYLGMIRTFSGGYNPVVFFNTCGSLIELGNNINFAGPRSMIGTMWSIRDSHAGDFAKSFFKYLHNSSLVSSFFKAKNLITDEYTKFSYVYWGTHNSYLPMRKEIKNEKLIYKHMANRLINSLAEAIQHYNQGILEEEDLRTLLNIKNLSEKFVRANLSSDTHLRQRLDSIQFKLDVALKTKE